MQVIPKPSLFDLPADFLYIICGFLKDNEIFALLCSCQKGQQVVLNTVTQFHLKSEVPHIPHIDTLCAFKLLTSLKLDVWRCVTTKGFDNENNCFNNVNYPSIYSLRNRTRTRLKASKFNFANGHTNIDTNNKSSKDSVGNHFNNNSSSSSSNGSCSSNGSDSSTSENTRNFDFNGYVDSSSISWLTNPYDSSNTISTFDNNTTTISNSNTTNSTSNSNNNNNGTMTRSSNRITKRNSLTNSHGFPGFKNIDKTSRYHSHVQKIVNSMKITNAIKLPCKTVTNSNNLASVCLLKHLKVLELGECLEINDWFPISQLVNLTSLKLGSIGACSFVNSSRLSNVNACNSNNAIDRNIIKHNYSVNTNTINNNNHSIQNNNNNNNNDNDNVQQQQLHTKDANRIHNLFLSLQSLINLRRLDLENCINGIEDGTQINLEPLKTLVNLTHINLGCFDGLTDISTLKYFPKLKYLNTRWCYRIRDFEPLGNLNHLIDLDLQACNGLQDLSFLNFLGHLKKLNLSYCHRISDLSPLIALKQLTTLNLRCCRMLKDLRSLEHLPGLLILDLSCCDRLVNLESLSYLTSLTTLYLSHCERITSLDALKNLMELKYLELNNCRSISTLYPLHQLINLEFIRMYDCPMIEDLNPLKHLRVKVLL
eukprot:Awhi_evm1s1696